MSFLLASPQNTLHALAVVLLAIYFFCFYRLVTSYPDECVLLASDRSAKRGNLLLGPLVMALVLAPMPYSAVAFCVGLPVLLGLGWEQYRRLSRLGASTAFLRHLTAVSCLAVTLMLAFGATLFLPAGS